jgi:hypothetical protein
MLPLRRRRSTAVWLLTGQVLLVKWPGCLRWLARAMEIDVTGHSSTLTAQK